MKILSLLLLLNSSLSWANESCFEVKENDSTLFIKQLKHNLFLYIDQDLIVAMPTDIYSDRPKKKIACSKIPRAQAKKFKIQEVTNKCLYFKDYNSKLKLFYIIKYQDNSYQYFGFDGAGFSAINRPNDKDLKNIVSCK